MHQVRNALINGERTGEIMEIMVVKQHRGVTVRHFPGKWADHLFR